MPAIGFISTVSLLMCADSCTVQFLERTFAVAKANVRINGRNLDEIDEDEGGTSERIICYIVLSDHYLRHD